MPHTHKSKSKSARADGGCVHCCVAGCAELRARNLLFSSLNFFSPECPEIACRVHRDGGEQAHQERTEIGGAARLQGVSRAGEATSCEFKKTAGNNRHLGKRGSAHEQIQLLEGNGSVGIVQ